MHRGRRWLLAAVIGLGVVASAPSASLARTPTKVEWASIRVPPGKASERTARTLRTLLTKAAKKADFGAIKSVTLSARVTEFTSERKGDVLQVSCTIVGRLLRGPSARSHISFGGSPAEREKLEKQVLEMVASGLVTRLAEIARARAPSRDDEHEGG